MNKSSTLQLLEKVLKSARVLPQVQIKFEELEIESEIIERLKMEFSQDERLVVRSSHSNEDTIYSSQAGKYLSILDVGLNEVIESARQVFDSYGSNKENQVVFVQTYMRNTKRSGVVFSHSPSSGKPYLIDNYVLSSDTESITSGASHGFKHVCLNIKFNECEDVICGDLRLVIDECRQILGYDYMNLEYALGSDSEMYLFQVRPLVIQNEAEIDFTELLESSRQFIKSRSRKMPFLAGDSTIYGVMPDWNPAEMIGRRPKRLALSLYRELITDSIWAYQRDNYGYKSLRSFPLLVEIGNQPFIDTRVSFNSLLPKGLPTELEDALVNFYLSRLSDNRNLHDKIEFEIVLSSWTFDIDEKLKFLPKGISSNQRQYLKKVLTSLTQSIVTNGLVDVDIERVTMMTKRKRIIEAETGDNVVELYWLLEDCKRWGTLPFAGLARAAFIATQIIKSLEVATGNQGILSNFIKGLNTVAGQMSNDLKSMDKNRFLQKYGHLRPGTYDITSKTYREAFDSYFSSLPTITGKIEIQYTEQSIIRLLEHADISSQLGVRASDFISFANKAIFWREQAKFEFTKNLSTVLDLIQAIGSELSIDRDELAFLDVKTLIHAYSNSLNLADAMKASIRSGKDAYMQAIAMELPSVIRNEREVIAFTEEDASPNFITNRSVIGMPRSGIDDISGAIVLIEGADPGYDWIFQKGILGLITAYGGANSHMAVRCAELDLPAAIGVGDRLFSELKNALQVNLDCGKRIIEFK